MKLLALRLCEHDSNISYFDGQKLHYFKSERKSQIKHHKFDNLWEWRVIIQKLWGVDYSEIDEIAITIDPWKHNLPKDLQKFYSPTNLAVEYDYFPTSPKCKVWRINHHYAHALSTWMLEDKKPDVSIVIDGFGDLDVAWTIFKDDKLIEENSVEKHGSLGVEFADSARALGVKVEFGLDLSGKLMGLQSYGKLELDYLEYLQRFDMYSIKELFNKDHWFKFKNDELVGQLTLLDWSRTVHQRIGEILVDFFKKYAKEDDVISYSGGVAQNVIWNTELKKHFPNLIIPPHCGDEGLTLGAIEFLRIKNNLPKFELADFPFCQVDETTDEVSDEVIEQTAKALANGKVVAWYQGHGEVGPRALGNRSILMNPMIPDAKTIVNKIKRREEYRPFGAVVLDEHKSKHFDLDFENPHMLYVANVKDVNLASITHVDNTCRIQTLTNENKSLRKLLEKFHEITGCPVLLNTSLNLAGKPIAAFKDNALELFNTSSLDCLVIGNRLYKKYK